MYAYPSAALGVFLGWLLLFEVARAHLETPHKAKRSRQLCWAIQEEPSTFAFRLRIEQGAGPPTSAPQPAELCVNATVFIADAA